MGRKGERVHEQSAGSSTPAFDYETIRLIPAQKQEATGRGSSVPWGISAPPGLDPPESRADTTKPPVGPITCPCFRSVNIVPYPAADVILRMYFINVSSMSIGSNLAQTSSD